MGKIGRSALTALLLGELFTISAVAHPRQVENQADVAWVHNTAKGKWDDSPRITLRLLEMFGDEADDNYLFYEPVAIAADKQGRGCHRIRGADLGIDGILDSPSNALKPCGRADLLQNQ